MASDDDFVEFLADQLDDDCGLTWRKMFGEFALYGHGRIFGYVCDDQLFVKPTEAGRRHIGEPVEAPPWPGARPAFLIREQVEDGEWLSELVRVTVRELEASFGSQDGRARGTSE